MAYLVDSNVIINYVAENFNPTVLSKLDKIFDLAFNHSVITIMEVLGFNGDPEEMEKFEKLFIAGQRFVIDNPVILETIKIRRITKIKLPDAIIGATAIVNNLQLLTSNTGDFSNVPGLVVIDPDTL